MVKGMFVLDFSCPKMPPKARFLEATHWLLSSRELK